MGSSVLGHLLYVLGAATGGHGARVVLVEFLLAVLHLGAGVAGDDDGAAGLSGRHLGALEGCG